MPDHSDRPTTGGAARTRRSASASGAGPSRPSRPSHPSRPSPGGVLQNPWAISGIASLCIIAMFLGAALPGLQHGDLGLGGSGRPAPKLWKANPADRLDHASVVVPGPLDATAAARLHAVPGVARVHALASGPTVVDSRRGVDATAFRDAVGHAAGRISSDAGRYVSPASFRTAPGAVPPPGVHAADVYSTNDPYYAYQWGLYNAGSSLGDGYPSTPRADVHAPEAWANADGHGVTVAIIDTGVEIDHPDLAANIWTNPVEPCDASTDLDADGHIGDCHGWNFADDNADVSDDGPDAGHGTHLAGTTAAVTGNGIGIAGVAPHAKLMVLKVGHGRLLSVPAILQAITYAADHGARVIATAFGDLELARRPGTDPELAAWRQAIDYAATKGSVIVTAAGNDRADIDRSEHLPATTSRPNVVVVGASDRDDNPSSFTNFGQTVDVVAPGEAIFSTWPGHTYRMANGTSTAVPFAAGTLAMILSQQPSLTAAQAIARLDDTAYGKSTLRDTSRTGGRVDAAAATNPAVLPDHVSFRGFHRIAPGTPTTGHIHIDAHAVGPDPTWHLSFAAACRGAVCGVTALEVRLTDPDGTTHDLVTDTTGSISRPVAAGASLDADLTFQLPVGQYALLASVATSDGGELAGVVYFGVDSRTQTWGTGVRPVAPTTTTTTTTTQPPTTSGPDPSSTTTTTGAGTTTTTTSTTTTTGPTTTTTTGPATTTTTVSPAPTTRPGGDLPPPPGGNNPDPNVPGTTTTTTATTLAPTTTTTTTTAPTTTAPTTTDPGAPTTTGPDRPSPSHPTANFQIWSSPASGAPGDIVTIRGGHLPTRVAVSFEHAGEIAYAQILIAQVDQTVLIVPSSNAVVTDVVVTDRTNPGKIDRIPDSFTFMPARPTTTTTAPSVTTPISTTTTLPGSGTTTTTAAGGGPTTTQPSLDSTTTTTGATPTTTLPPAPTPTIPGPGSTVALGGGLTGIVLPAGHRLALTPPGAWAPMQCVSSVCAGGSI